VESALRLLQADFNPEIGITPVPSFQIEHKINLKVDASSCGTRLSKIQVLNRQKMQLLKRPAVCVPNSHAICSTLIGCIL